MSKQLFYRVNRGGGWYDSVAGLVRAADRFWCGTAVRVVRLGFRCALRTRQCP